MKKITITLILLIISSLVITMPIFAQNTALTEQLEDQYKNALDEMNKDIEPTEPYTFDNCMPVYAYEDFWGGEYDETLASHISDEFYWETDGENWTKIFYKKDSVWQEGSSATTPDFVDKDGEKIDVSFSLSWFMNKALQEVNKEISDFKIVCCENKYMIYFVSEGTEYIIPYDIRSDLSGIENGKLYKASEITEIINSSSSGISMDDMPEDEVITYGGSVGTNNTEPDRTGLIVTISVISALIVSVIAVYIKKKKS